MGQKVKGLSRVDTRPTRVQDAPVMVLASES